MNGPHHGDLMACALQFARVPKDKWPALIHGCANADYLDDVQIAIPLEGKQPEVFGRHLTSLQHFQLPDGTGYYWDGDPSLGVLEEIGEAMMHVARAKVSGTSLPILRACTAQPGAVLSDLHFPSAANLGNYYSTFPDFSEENGRAAHMVMDACLAFHARGMLVGGHLEFENELQRLWVQHREEIKLSGDPSGCTARLREQVEEALITITADTVEQLCRDNAAWALREFPRTPTAECSITDCLLICIRAIASAMRGLEIMKGAYRWQD